MSSGTEVKTVYKQDIDDNCPLTGDETDTEDIHNFVDNDKAKEASATSNDCTLSPAIDEEEDTQPCVDCPSSSMLFLYFNSSPSVFDHYVLMNHSNIFMRLFNCSFDRFSK